MADEDAGAPIARPAGRPRRRSAPAAIGVPTGAMSGLASIIKRPVPAAPVDELDLELLRHLSRDARLSHRALSRLVALSPPAVGERLARLERLGVVRGYTLDIDWAALGYPMTVYMAMTAAPGADLRDVIATLQKMPELDDVHIVTGQWDLICRFHLRNQPHLQEVLLVQIWQIAGVQRVETFLGLGSYTGEGLLGPVPEPAAAPEGMGEREGSPP